MEEELRLNKALKQGFINNEIYPEMDLPALWYNQSIQREMNMKFKGLLHYWVTFTEILIPQWHDKELRLLFSVLNYVLVIMFSLD